MTYEEYQQIPGLSNSMIKDLKISPYQFWYRQINPDRPREEATPEMQFGSALHCMVLEPDQFLDRYACEIIPPADGWLETMDDLRNWLRESGEKPKGTRKAEAIAQVQSLAPNWPIADVMRARHAAQHAGKVIFKAEDWARLDGCNRALRAEPELVDILNAGEAELFVASTNPHTGVTLKGKLDWVAADGRILDIKTFTQKRGKTLDRSIADAIYYEDYIQQAVVYRRLLPAPSSYDMAYVLAFVQSEPPHEVRLRCFKNRDELHWQTAEHEVNRLVELYRQCRATFGDAPWREPQEIKPLEDEEFPGLVYG